MDNLIEREWIGLDSVGVGQKVTLPANWKEIYLTAYITYTDNRVIIYTVRVAHDTVTSSTGKVIHSFYSGFTYATNDYGGCRFDVTEETCSLNWFMFGTSLYYQAKMKVRYK